MELRIQEFLTLSCSDKMKAIAYAKKWLKPYAISDSSTVSQAMATLAFPDPLNSPYSYLFSNERWDNLILQFKEDSSILYGLPVSAMLTVDFQAGLSVLKTELVIFYFHVLL